MFNDVEVPMEMAPPVTFIPSVRPTSPRETSDKAPLVVPSVKPIMGTASLLPNPSVAPLPAVAKPVLPAVNKPPVLSMAKPALPAVNKPPVLSMAKPVLPAVNKPAPLPAVNKPVSPVLAPLPAVNKPVSPVIAPPKVLLPSVPVLNKPSINAPKVMSPPATSPLPPAPKPVLPSVGSEKSDNMYLKEILEQLVMLNRQMTQFLASK